VRQTFKRHATGTYGSHIRHETQNVDAGNLARIQESASLSIGEIVGNGYDAIGHGHFGLGFGDFLEFGKVHGAQLGEGEDLLFTTVLNLRHGI
jgi:hypothetical protein